MKPLRAAELNRRVTFEKPTTTRTSSGGATRTWARDFDRWVKIEPLRGTEGLTDGQVKAEATHRVTMRATDSVTVGHRIKWHRNGTTRYLNLLAPLEASAGDRLEVQAVEQVAGADKV